ncbi:SMI1/KNR4 family protein [Streptomyces sp. NPDC087300]|uniref:SMI1/KNR4 family protein n=1 Tax=Streptomyces sp. NPDC087300 TaxID=3365780 RepID=UPI00381F4349
MEVNAPLSAQALSQPATDEDIATLGRALRCEIPDVLEAWLRLNNGSTAKDSRRPEAGGFKLIPHLGSKIFPGGEVFLDCQGIIDRYQNHLRIADDIGDEDWWKPSWIPALAETDAHYGLLLDAGHPGGTVPVLRFRETDNAKAYASSLGELLGVSNVGIG